MEESKLKSDSEVASRELLTVREVAEWLRVHEKTVYAWVEKGQREKGKLPCIRLGKQLRFRASDVSRWLQAPKEGD